MQARRKTTRYAFDEVKKALDAYWGLSLHRGGDRTDLGRDGRFDTVYSKTGYVVSGAFPGNGYSSRRFRSLGRIVKVCDLEKTIAKERGR
jgi:hypothetical protein